MTFQFQKILVEDWPYRDQLPEGVGTVCQLSRRMPDGQKFASVFYLSKDIGRDRKAMAAVIKMQKDEVRRRTDHEWKYGKVMI